MQVKLLVPFLTTRIFPVIRDRNDGRVPGDRGRGSRQGTLDDVPIAHRACHLMLLGSSQGVEGCRYDAELQSTRECACSWLISCQCATSSPTLYSSQADDEVGKWSARQPKVRATKTRPVGGRQSRVPG